MLEKCGNIGKYFEKEKKIIIFFIKREQQKTEIVKII